MRRIARGKLLAVIIAGVILVIAAGAILRKTNHVRTITVTGEGTGTRITCGPEYPGQSPEDVPRITTTYTYRKILINGTQNVSVDGDITLDDVEQIYDTVLNDTDHDSRAIFWISADNDTVSVYKGICSEYGMFNRITYHYEKQADAWVLTDTLAWLGDNTTVGQLRAAAGADSGAR